MFIKPFRNTHVSVHVKQVFSIYIKLSKIVKQLVFLSFRTIIVRCPIVSDSIQLPLVINLYSNGNIMYVIDKKKLCNNLDNVFVESQLIER